MKRIGLKSTGCGGAGAGVRSVGIPHDSEPADQSARWNDGAIVEVINVSVADL